MSIPATFLRPLLDGPTLLPLFFDAALKGLVILALTALATLAMRRASAAAKHLVWFSGTLGLLLLPLVSLALPVWHVLPHWALNHPMPSRPAAMLRQVAPPITLPATNRHPAGNDLSRPETPVAAPAAAQSAFQLTWQAWALLIWLSGTVLIVGYVVLGFSSLWWLRRQSFRVNDVGWQSLLRQLCRQLGVRRPVELLSSPRRTMPMTWGVRQTRLLLPENFATWQPELRRAVLLHELAHVKRADCLTQLLTQLACALYWFNPLVWLARRCMQSERERACDDLVLTTGTRASAYAEQLLHIAAEMSLARLSGAAIAMAQPNKLKERLLAIFDTTRNRRLATRTVVWVLAAVGLGTGILASLGADQLSENPALAVVSRWATQHGWRAQTVTPTNLEAPFGLPGWRSLPFSLTKEEEADARACIKIANKARSSVNGKTEFSDPAIRVALEEVLKNRPNYFYAEFLLSMWHRDDGDPRQAAQLLNASYEHAPVIAVQRFELTDGTPLVNAAIYSFALECNRVEQRSLDQINLEYLNLRTDAEGCIYLPVYDTVYRRYQVSGPYGYSVTFPELGWFQTSRKVALLPVATVTSNPGDFVPASSPGSAPISRADLPDGNSAELVAVSHDPPDRQNRWWLADGSASDHEYETIEPNPSGWQTGPKWRFIVRFAKPLADDAHFELRCSVPKGFVRIGTVRGEDPHTTRVLFNSFPTQPQTLALRLGTASGAGKTLAYYDPHTHRTTGDLPAGFTFVNAEELADGAHNYQRTEVVLSHPEVDQQLRVYAIDFDGHEHPAGSSSHRTGTPLAEGEVEDGFGFWRLPMENIASFRLEARDYQWVEFDNIALNPTTAGDAPAPAGAVDSRAEPRPE